MIVCPLLGIPLLVLLGREACPHWLFVALLVPTGLILWGTTPAMVSYAQQLFPNGGGVASAITMGLAWGLGGLIQSPLTAYFGNTSAPQHAFLGCIPFLAFAALGAWCLPHVPADTPAGELSNEVVAVQPNRVPTCGST
jgi:MFS family permease